MDLEDFSNAKIACETGIFHSYFRKGIPGNIAYFPKREDLDDFVAGPLQLLKNKANLADFTYQIITLKELKPPSRPVIFVSSPGADTGLIMEALTFLLPHFWTLGRVPFCPISQLPGIRLRDRDFTTTRLDGSTSDALARNARESMICGLRNREVDLFLDTEAKDQRALYKTPAISSLQIPFLRKIFPDAVFVWLITEPTYTRKRIERVWQTEFKAVEELAHYAEYYRSMFWRDGESISQLPNWPSGEAWKAGEWKMVLPPGWQSLSNPTLGEVSKFQWLKCTSLIRTDLEKVAEHNRYSIELFHFLNHPERELRSLADFLGEEIDLFASDSLRPFYDLMREKVANLGDNQESYCETVREEWDQVRTTHHAWRKPQ